MQILANPGKYQQTIAHLQILAANSVVTLEFWCPDLLGSTDLQGFATICILVSRFATILHPGFANIL